MRIGLLSDSHGQAAVTRRAVALLATQALDCLIHLGDIMSVEVIDALVEPAPVGVGFVPAHVVFGNCDFQAAAMARYARELGLFVHDPVGRIDSSDGAVVFMHGHDDEAMRRALATEPAYFCHGHTHHRRDERIGPTRFINPGALHRASIYTVAVLDTQTGSLEFLEVSRS